MVSLPVAKMGVLGKMWTEAVPSVRAFFEEASQRQNQREEVKDQGAGSKVSTKI